MFFKSLKILNITFSLNHPARIKILQLKDAMMESNPMMEADTNLIKSTVRGFSRAIILWLISQRPMSGYNIIKEIKRLTGQNFYTGIVYPLLYEFEEGGFIVGEWTQKGGRRIKHYSMTNKGTQLLNRLRQLFKLPIKEVLKDFIGEISEHKP
ncbi:MAG: PadR family transcriptional regulator [Candidatus Bathyarchaeia archaeon]